MNERKSQYAQRIEIRPFRLTFERRDPRQQGYAIGVIGNRFGQQWIDAAIEPAGARRQLQRFGQTIEREKAAGLTRGAIFV
jgi:hypothetical protein